MEEKEEVEEEEGERVEEEGDEEREVERGEEVAVACEDDKVASIQWQEKLVNPFDVVFFKRERAQFFTTRDGEEEIRGKNVSPALAKQPMGMPNSKPVDGTLVDKHLSTLPLALLRICAAAIPLQTLLSIFNLLLLYYVYYPKSLTLHFTKRP